MTPDQWLQRAIALSQQHMQANAGGPFGAVIVRGDQLVAEGWNQVTSSVDPTAHAEVVAIRHACKALNNFSLAGCVLYTSCEPCPMCLAAAYWARVDRIVFAAGRADAAAIGFDDAFIYEQIPLPTDQRSVPMQQALRDDAVKVFQMWQQKTDRTPY
jgi:tRNA(Arg) A34 adenosine deaminase TadA